MEPCKEAYLLAREKRKFPLNSELKHVYGKSSSKHPDPSVSELLKWNDSCKEIWNYKTNDKHIIHQDPFTNIQKSINPSHNNWISESQDAYKGFFHIQDDIYDSVDPNIALPFSCNSCKEIKKPTTSKRKNRKHKVEKRREKNRSESKSSYYSHSNSKSRSKSNRHKKDKFKSEKKNHPHPHHNSHKHHHIGDETKERLKQFHAQTKWLPNTSMNTYYGKVPFDNYGRGNTKSKLDGFLYGNYLKSFNVNPHRGENLPQYYQTFGNTLTHIENQPDLKPEPPRKVMELYRLTDEQVKTQNSRNPVFPEKNQIESQHIKKPKLEKARRFNPEYFDEKQKRKANKKKLQSSLEEYPSKSHSKSPNKHHSKSKKKPNKGPKKDKKVQIQEEEEAGFLYSKGINDPRDREYNVREYLEKKKVSQDQYSNKITSSHYSNTMNKNERNPQFYNGKNSSDLERIPFAGKKISKPESTNFLHHEYK